MDLSIIIPLKNEERNIRNLLDSIYKQKTEFVYEIIAVDSGSVDSTPEILNEYENLTVIRIPEEEFGHGKTRNLGAMNSSGDYILFVNADARPVSEFWLDNLIKPMSEDNTIAAVYSRHIPDKECNLFMKRDLLNSMPEQSEFIKSGSLLNRSFSTVSGAVRADIFREHPFRSDILIAEDLEWAERILEMGFSVLYEPKSEVIHSHNYTPEEFYRIKYRLGLSEYSRFKTGAHAVLGGFFLAVSGIIWKLTGDFIYIFRSDCNFRSKISESVLAVKMRYAGFWGRYLGWVRKK